VKLKTSVKLSENGIIFLKKLRTNRRKAGTDEQDLSYWKLIDVIANYFKANNDEYLKIVNMEFKKNA